MTRRGPAPLPRVLLGVGAVTDPRALARFDDLQDVLLPVGPVEAGSRRRRPGRPVVHGLGVGGLDHEDVRAIGVDGARELLAWVATRGLGGFLGVRGATTGDLAAVVDRVHRSVEGDAVRAVEVDLRGADEQTVLRSMSRVREAAPRDQQLLARLAAADPDLVSCARSAVAGGATGVVVSGQVPLGAGRWWSGPSTAALCLAGLRLLTTGATEQRWPGAPLVAAGGVHSAAAARAALAEGASSVQLGTALWADPTLLAAVREAVRPSPAGDTSRPGTRPSDPPWRTP